MKREFLSLLIASSLFAQVPRIMNYQGKLTDPYGVGLNGTYDMVFRIYNAPVGGTLLWEELHSLVNPVTVTNGLFDVVLGEMSPFNIAFDDTYWLEIQIGTEILTPRRKLAPVPYAFRALICDSVPYGAVWTGGPGQVAYGTSNGFLYGSDSLRWSGGALWLNGYLRVSGTGYPVARVTKTGSAPASTEANFDLLLTYLSGDMQDNFGTGITMSVQDMNEGPIRIGGIYATRETSDSTGKLLFFTRGPEDTQWTTKMTIDRRGFVGIGTSTPNNLLEVVGGADASETDLLQLRSKFASANTATTLKFVNSNTQNTDYGAAEISAMRDTPGNCDLIFRASDGGTMKECMRIIGDNGNVGIGTALPNTRLEINSGISNVSGLRFTQLTSTSPAGAPVGKVLSVDAGGNVILVRDSIGAGGTGTGEWEDAGTYKRPANPTNDNVRVYESASSGGVYASVSGGYAFQGLYTGTSGIYVEGRVASPGMGLYAQVFNTGSTGAVYAIEGLCQGSGSGANRNWGILGVASDGDNNVAIAGTNHPTTLPTIPSGDYAGLFNWRVRITDENFTGNYPTIEFDDGGTVRGIRLSGTSLQYQDASGTWQNFGVGGSSLWISAGSYLYPSGGISDNIQVANVQSHTWGFYANMSGTYGGFFITSGSYGVFGQGGTYGVYGQYDSNRFGYLGNQYDGIFGRTNQSLGVGIGGRNTNTSGTGCAASGNNIASLPALTAGSGGAFRGAQFGCFADQTSSVLTPRAAFIGQYYDATATLREVRVGYCDGANTYKISGTGLVSTIMGTRGGERHLFAPEATEAWFFDMDEVRLQNGKARVEVDPIFLDCITVDRENPLKVFVQGAEGTIGAIKVVRGDTWFELEDTGGPSNGTVIYQVYGKWKGMEGKRLLPEYGSQKVMELNRE